MADITMCSDKECPAILREYCHRATAKADPVRQSYFTESPREGKTCEYFLEMQA